MSREIQLHSALNHENIIEFYAAFEDLDNVYMVQEYAHGERLASVCCVWALLCGNHHISMLQTALTAIWQIEHHSQAVVTV